MSNIPRASHVHKNEVHLAGEIAKDPTIRYTSGGKCVASLTVVTRYQQSSEHHKVTAWEHLAEKAGKLTKGEFVRIVGRLQTRSWDDKNSGQKKYVTEIVAFQLVIPAEEPEPLTPDATKSGTNVARAILSPSKTTTKNAHGVEVSDADIPF